MYQDLPYGISERRRRKQMDTFKNCQKEQNTSFV